MDRLSSRVTLAGARAGASCSRRSTTTRSSSLTSARCRTSMTAPSMTRSTTRSWASRSSRCTRCAPARAEPPCAGACGSGTPMRVSAASCGTVSPSTAAWPHASLHEDARLRAPVRRRRSAAPSAAGNAKLASLGCYPNLIIALIGPAGAADGQGAGGRGDPERVRHRPGRQAAHRRQDLLRAAGQAAR